MTPRPGEAALTPIAREGAALVEVMVWLQHVLQMLLRVAHGPDARALRAASHDAEDRAVAALSSPLDVEKVRAAAQVARLVTAAPSTDSRTDR